MGVLLDANDRSLCRALARPLLTVPAKMRRSPSTWGICQRPTKMLDCLHRQDSPLLPASEIGPSGKNLRDAMPWL
jgi:hypothetical protein